jgi:hypothetical protein
MRDYSTVSPKFWIGATGKALRGDPPAQLLALYLVTSPHSSMTGVFYCPVAYMAHETGLTLQGAQKALSRLIEVGFCDFDDATDTIFVVRMASFQVGDDLKEKDNRVIGIRKEVERMPRGLIRQRFIALYGKSFRLDDLAEKDSPPEAPSEPLRSQEQEQEQEQEEKNSLRSLSDHPPDDPLAWPRDYREQFWSRYPHKVGKDKALQKLDAIAKSRKVAFVDLMAGLERYIASKPPNREWCNPQTWLNGGRWKDEPAAAVVPFRPPQRPIALSGRI